MTDASSPEPASAQTADADGHSTSYEELLRYARDEVEEDKQALNALLSSSARGSHAI
jgi:hypothetical protein